MQRANKNRNRNKNDQLWSPGLVFGRNADRCTNLKLHQAGGKYTGSGEACPK